MPTQFKKIGLLGRQRTPHIVDTLMGLVNFLHSRQLQVITEAETAALLPANTVTIVNREDLGAQAELMIVVGGDGSLLHAARIIVDNQVPVVGINRGRLGFLTDIHPSELEKKLTEVLAGQYVEEQRFLLTTTVVADGQQPSYEESALNDVVLLPGDVAHMIEFAIYLNEQYVCSQRADGLIVATPTGSTAYALSGGGPILHPTLDAIVLVPMFPHTLSSRPLVVAGSAQIKIVIAPENEAAPKLSCDGRERWPLAPGSIVHIAKKPEHLRLIHPLDYNYYQTLRSKLHWSLNY